MIRKIVQIDESKCNGCGLCVPNCAEGAIKIIDGKAKLISDNLCDGLGACLGHCPLDAIQVIERDADEFDEAAVHNHRETKAVKEQPTAHHHHTGGCPGSRMRMFNETPDDDTDTIVSDQKSQLRQWPIQLHLVSVNAPYFNNADLLVTADCVPFAYANYHSDLLKGKKVVVGCPKLDDVGAYTEKLTQIIANNDLKSITVAFMEVPCCNGIVMAVERALKASGKDTVLHKVRISIDGNRMS